MTLVNCTPLQKHLVSSMTWCGIPSTMLREVPLAEQERIPFPEDHYKWLDLVAAEAAQRFQLKFNPNDYAVAHGDKCYSHKRAWKNAGVPFERGVFIYLLLSEPPYSGYVRDTANGWVAPNQWVIDYYHANDGLVKIFDEIEARLFLPK